MSVFQQRLIESKDASGLTWAEIAKLAGISKSLISHYKSGRNMPLSDNLYRLAKILNVDPAWLAGYDVILPDLLPPEKDLISGYRRLDDEDQLRVSGYIDGLLEQEKYKR